MTVSWMAKRWCVVEQDEQQDLFVGDPWHMHLVDINLRLDTPVERSLCGDLLPSQPVYRVLQSPFLKSLCPQCMDMARTHRKGVRPTSTRMSAAVAGAAHQFDLYA